MHSIKASDIIEFLEENIIGSHGCPKAIISDRGTQFTSHEFSEAVARLGIEHKMTTPYHPQCNGMDERLNGTLVRILRVYVGENQHDWDEKLKWAVFAYNITQHESSGYSPYQMLYGLQPRSPLNGTTGDDTTYKELNAVRQIIRDLAAKKIEEAQDRQAKNYNRKHSEFNMTIGQMVMVKKHNVPLDLSKKFYSRWYGPCHIIGFIGDNHNPKAVEILDIMNKAKRTVSIADVKPYQLRTQYEDAHTPDEFLAKRKGDERDEFDRAGYYLNTWDEDANLVDVSEDIFLSPDAHMHGETFDVVQVGGEPKTSSPRRVRISDFPQRILYTPEKSIDNVNQRSIANPQPDEVIDNFRKDPTYKLAIGDIPASTRVTRSQSKLNEENLSSQNKDLIDLSDEAEISSIAPQSDFVRTSRGDTINDTSERSEDEFLDCDDTTISQNIDPLSTDSTFVIEERVNLY